MDTPFGNFDLGGGSDSTPPDGSPDSSSGGFASGDPLNDPFATGRGIDPSVIATLFGGNSNSYDNNSTPSSVNLHMPTAADSSGAMQNAAPGGMASWLLSKLGASDTTAANAQTWLNKLTSGDKQSMNQLKLGLGALGLLHSLTQNRNPRGQLSIGQMQGMTASPYNNWTPQQQVHADAYFNNPLPTFHYQPPHYAAGGLASDAVPYTEYDNYAAGGLASDAVPHTVYDEYSRLINYAHGGAAHGPGCPCPMCNGGALTRLAGGGQNLVRGGAGGQQDNVNAMLSPGEYVMDADSVSALGDGNNEAGAQALDRMREAIRAHKRSAPADTIPPKAKAPLTYLKERSRGG